MDFFLISCSIISLAFVLTRGKIIKQSSTRILSIQYLFLSDIFFQLRDWIVTVHLSFSSQKNPVMRVWKNCWTSRRHYKPNCNYWRHPQFCLFTWPWRWNSTSSENKMFLRNSWTTELVQLALIMWWRELFGPFTTNTHSTQAPFPWNTS